MTTNAQQQEFEISGRDFYRKVAKMEPAFFHQYYLDPEHPVVWHQQEMFDFAEDVSVTTRRGICLEPRDHLKSTSIAFSWVTKKIAENHNLRILIAQKTQKEADKTVVQISDALRDEKLKQDFDIVFRGVPTSSRFTLRRSKRMKDPTCEGVGAGGAITGGHFDIIICDDILDVRNSRTPGERQAVKDWFYGTLSFVIEPDTVILFIATRKHFEDLSGELLKNVRYKKLIRKAIIKMPESYEYVLDDQGNAIDVKNIKGDYQVLFPEKWSIKDLLLTKAEVGSIEFNREMQNEPLSQEDAAFRREWLQYYRWGSEIGENKVLFPRVWKRRISYVDLAISQSDKADYFVLLPIVIDHQNRVYVEPYTRGRFTFPEQAKIILDHLTDKKPWRCGVEANAYQMGLVQHVQPGTMRPVIPVKKTKNKEERIIGTLSPMFEAGKIFIHESMRELIEEYLQFGKSEHDDIMDALEGAVAMAMEQPVLGIKRRMRLL